ncbi:hypothetical protein IJH72_02810 [Candidatus Saccharibacteria bacterium]|nr:hypothetical protein [Candidatus Saccharibacteria bacterium]MBR0372842.1 hypothetical protein [Candidatus Saccharibacteria bacterium]
MTKKLKLLVSVALIGGLLLGGLKAFAIDTSDMKSMMTISPPREKMVLNPGDVYEGSINVASSANAEKDLKYSVHIGSFSMRKDENGNTDYNDTDVDTITGYNQIMEWITLGKESGSVAPNSIDSIPYTITVPKDAPAGGQYASIIIRNDTGMEDEANGNVAIQDVVEFAVGILAEVTGDTRDEGVIIENSLPSFVFNNRFTATSTVRNDGNVHTDAKYVLQVWPLFSDEEVCTNEEEPNTSLIMPETERIHTEECGLPAFGIYRAKQTVTIFGETSVAEKTFIFCPLWLLFLIIFGIILLALWIIAKSRAKKEDKGSEK